ncbi:MAG: DUF1343 domain-containing protein [Bacteroidota bacterium]
MIQANCSKSPAEGLTSNGTSAGGRIAEGVEQNRTDTRSSERESDLRQSENPASSNEDHMLPIQVGADRVDQYLPLLQGKRIALVVNQTSMVGETHLVDTLLALGQNIAHLFAPEHGFRDMASAGETIDDSRDPLTGLPIISLYGSKKEPSNEDLAGVDLIIFDIQDVGVRFYTYISTLHYVMRAAARTQTPVLVLDRPNPNGQLVDGPVMESGYTSFVGIHTGVPVLHGMTVGEYALMTNGEGWLGEGLKADLQVITCAHYRRSMTYELPIPPSPNLPNQRSIYLYPSLCFFEGTSASIGRGTDMQFQVIGHPDWPSGKSDIVFTPEPNSGSRYPKLEGELCHGWNYTTESADSWRAGGFSRLRVAPLIEWSNQLGADAFFSRISHFDRLAGSDALRTQISSGMGEADIQASWTTGLEAFLNIRKQYLLYGE